MHEGGWTIEATRDGGFLFADPSGRLWPAVPKPPRLGDDPLADLDRDHRALGLAITDKTVAHDWTDIPMDYALAIDVLCDIRNRARRARDPTAGSG